jgi:hypothetical protein
MYRRRPCSALYGEQNGNTTMIKPAVWKNAGIIDEMGLSRWRGSSALLTTSLRVCIDFAVRRSCAGLKENKVMLAAHARGMSP